MPTTTHPHPDGVCTGGVCDCGGQPCGSPVWGSNRHLRIRPPSPSARSSADVSTPPTPLLTSRLRLSASSQVSTSSTSPPLVYLPQSPTISHLLPPSPVTVRQVSTSSTTVTAPPSAIGSSPSSSSGQPPLGARTFPVCSSMTIGALTSCARRTRPYAAARVATRRKGRRRSIATRRCVRVPDLLSPSLTFSHRPWPSLTVPGLLPPSLAFSHRPWPSPTHTFSHRP